MKNKILLCIFTVIVSVSSIHVAHATVGGERYLSNFSYNSKDKNIFFYSISMDAIDCSDRIHYINSKTGKENISITSPCELGEGKYLQKLRKYEKNPETNKMEYSYEADENKLKKYLASIFSKMKPLKEFSFEKEGYSTEVSFMKPKQYSKYEEDYYFIASVKISKKGREVGIFEFKVCRTIPPKFTFYKIPNSKNILIVVRSVSEWCSEGGYEGDQVVLVKNFFK